MDYIKKYFQDHYIPPVNKAILSFTPTTTDDTTITLEIDPIALASVSSLFRTLPPADVVFDVNHQNFLTQASDIECFISMCGTVNNLPLLNSKNHQQLQEMILRDIKREYAGEDLSDVFLADLMKNRSKDCATEKCYNYIGRWNYENFYAASKLCDFMGITATKDCLSMCDDGLHDKWWRESFRIRVLFHQIALKTNNTVIVNELENKFTECMIEHKCECGDENHEEIKSDLQNANDKRLALQMLYHEFGDNSVYPLFVTKLLEEDQFLIDMVGWSEYDNDVYGHTIRFRNPRELKN